MSASTVLIVEAIIALVTLGMAYKDAKDITADEIRAELEKVFDELEKKDPNLLPDV